MMDCPRIAGHRCVSTTCPGLNDPSACRQLASLAQWRKLPESEQVDKLESNRPGIDPMVRDAVNACSFRGSVLPISEQDDCGCRGKERTECRAGKGVIAGRVTLRDCLDCQKTQIDSPG
jgi:hypothetical protein